MMITIKEQASTKGRCQTIHAATDQTVDKVGLAGGAVLAMAISAFSAQALAEDLDDFVLEEIIVTAEKIGAKSIMDTSFSISAMNGEKLEEQGITSVADAIAMNPGVSSVEVGGGGNNALQIRGVSSLFGDSTVGYYLDDLPYTQVGQQFVPDTNPYDLERIEVLRGPQGTLYGASSQGGTVRVLTREPQHNEFEFKANAGVSSTSGHGDSWKVQAAVNLPLIEDTLSARLVASRVDEDGFIDLPLTGEDDYNDGEDKSYRAKLLFTPGDNFTLKLSAWHSEVDTAIPYGDDNYEFSPLYVEFDPLSLPALDPAGARPVTAEDLRSQTEFDLYNMTMEYDFENISLYSTTSLIESEQQLDSNVLGSMALLPVENRTLNQELRLASTGDSDLSWTAGVFYMDAKQEQQLATGLLLAGVPDPVMAVAADQQKRSQQWAVFGEAHYEFNDEWKLTLGTRYFEDEREEEDLDATTISTLALFGIDAKRSEEFDKVTSRVNVSYTPNEDSLYYLNVAQGFRSGVAQQGISLLSAAAASVSAPQFSDPEDLISYELGTKLSFMDDKLQLEVAVYYLQWDDIITVLTTIDSVTLLPIAYAENVGEAEGVGLDLGVLYRGIPGLTLQVSGNFNSTEYGEALPLANVDDGDTVVQVPETTFSASAAYQWALSDSGLDGRFHMAYQYTDGRPDYTLGASTESDSFAVLNARLGVEAESWSVYLTGENLTDEDGQISLLASTAPLGVPANRMRPRTIGLEASYRY
ncbi:TonB-dependent receptor [Pseudomaricurvus alkylphenolicus]|uniref:TonB-dependent receptor n=1 Tax=Pseudomaricurvus alkylphenolicus TaxID=1306991 RepID=UPI0014219A2F|nr:TonB-dependent receptor [Pseudomaricurvus alkylphenolicus]NIB41599.1 TonB-dependent receptor [Pseudomaricurvus alkylphenolicus]